MAAHSGEFAYRSVPRRGRSSRRSEELWGQNVPKGWGRVSEKPKLREDTARTEEASSPRRVDGGGGGEKVRTQEAGHDMPEERHLLVSPSSVKSPAGEEGEPHLLVSPSSVKPPAGEEGGLGDTVHGDIPRIVESALERRLSTHEQALQALLQGMLNEQRAKFDSSLEQFWGRLSGLPSACADSAAAGLHKAALAEGAGGGGGHEAQVDKLTAEVVNSNGALGRQLAEAAQEMAGAVATGTATIIEHLQEANEQTRAAQLKEEAARTELMRHLSRSQEWGGPGQEGAGPPPEAPSKRPSPSEATSERPTGSGSEASSEAGSAPGTPATGPDRRMCSVSPRRVRRWIQRSYSENLREYMHREKKDSILAFFVDSRVFDCVMVCVILLHLVYLIHQTNKSFKALQPPSGPTHVTIEACFLLAYSIELALKLVTQRWHFVFGPDRMANTFDFFLLVAGVVDVVATQSQANNFPGGSAALRVFRMFRLHSVARLHRLFKVTQALQVILRCLYSCGTSLFGLSVIIILYFMFFSLFFVSAVTEQLMEGKGLDRLEFYTEHFGSVSACMFTLYASVSSGKGWLYFYWPLRDLEAPYVSVAFVVFTFLYMVVMVNVASSIFVQKVLVHTLDETQNAKHEGTRADHRDAARMLEFCARRYGDGDSVSYKEFLNLMVNAEFRDHLTARKVRLDDAEALFRAFARPPSGERSERTWQLFRVDRRLFFEACMRLKREVTTAELSKSKVALHDSLHDSQQRHCDLVMSTLDKLGLQLEVLSRNARDARRGGAGRHMDL